jgi:DNA ligase D-like protein (predicted 3'-phosphoesterase)
VQKRAQESAVGIPDRSSFGDVENLPVDELMNYVVQEHDAHRAGKHYDMRFGPDDLHSWAVPKGLPRPGERRLAIQQPLHEGQYAYFEGEIPEGEYGAGTVKTHDKGTVLITKTAPGQVHFVVTHRGVPERFALIHTKGKDWVLINSTPQTSKVHEYHKKMPYKKIPEDEVEKVLDGSYAVSAKIDGAAALFHVLKDKIEAISYRTDKEGRPIVHTHRIPGLTSLQLPKSLHGTILRGELYAERGGRTLKPQEIGGLLNASVENSRRKQERDKIKMKAAIFRVLKDRNKVVDPKGPYNLQRVRDIVAQLPSDVFNVPPTETDPIKSRKLFEDIRAGKVPLTREGVVATPLAGGVPRKIKFLKEYDVPIAGVFPAVTKSGPPRAGGFEYRTDAGAARVGTGFTHETLRDMLENPDKYIGRMARVKSQDRFPGGALRAPSFIALHEDIPQKAAGADAEKDKEWIGVDLDGTLAKYEKWEGPGAIGNPIDKMVKRVRRWLAEGKTVKIFTARMAGDDGTARRAIRKWCKDHIGQELEVTNRKDPHCVQIWDDRAVSVEKNTGTKKAEESSDEKEARDVNEWGWSAVRITGPLRSKILDAAAKVADEDIYNEPGYGREDDPHVTVKYGIDSGDESDIAKAVNGIGPGTGKVSSISIFDNSFGDDASKVLKLDITSSDLKELNKAITDNIDCPGDGWPSYHAHVTLAYLKPDADETKYTQDTSLVGETFDFDEILFRGKGAKDGEESMIKLEADEEKEGQALSKEDIVGILEEHGHNDMRVGGGAAMVLRGLRDTTRDIDAAAPAEVFTEIHQKYGGPELSTSMLGSSVFTIPETPIDLHQVDDPDEEIERLANIPGLVETEDELLKFYERLNRPKDQEWIKILRQRRNPKVNRIIEKLKEVKALSDKRQYQAKHARAMELIQKYPDKFVIDSEGDGIVGITHKATGFRFHLPKQVIAGVELEKRSEVPMLLNMEITNGDEKKAELLVEFAESPKAQAYGLGGRPMMPDNFGMLFKSAKSFWMKNCNFDLDAAFLARDGRILDIQHMTKESYPKSFEPRADGVVNAIELPSGWCKANGVEIGDLLKLRESQDD